MNVLAVVVAGGSCASLDVLTPVAGIPMAVRSVRAVLASGIVDHVFVDAGARTPDVLRACGRLPVSGYEVTEAHARQRAGATEGDGSDTERSDDVLVVHDADRPLAPPGLFRDVLTAARGGHSRVVPVLPLTDTVKLVDGAGLVRGTPDRSGLRVVQTPTASRPGAAVAGAHTVPGDPLAFPVRTAWDLEMAELLLEGL